MDFTRNCKSKWKRARAHPPTRPHTHTHTHTHTYIHTYTHTNKHTHTRGGGPSCVMEDAMGRGSRRREYLQGRSLSPTSGRLPPVRARSERSILIGSRAGVARLGIRHGSASRSQRRKHESIQKPNKKNPHPHTHTHPTHTHTHTHPPPPTLADWTVTRTPHKVEHRRSPKHSICSEPGKKKANRKKSYGRKIHKK